MGKKPRRKAEIKNKLLKTLLGCSTLCLLMVFTSCSSESQGDVRVVIKRADPPSPTIVTAIASDIDLGISSYHLSLYGPNSSSMKVERELTSDESQTLFQTLPTGNWKLRIQAKNADGKTVQSLCYDAAVKDRLQNFTISRGKMTDLHCTLVPYTAGEGMLSLSVNWTAVDDKLIPDYSEVVLQVTPLTNVEGLENVAISGSESIDAQTVTAESVSITMSPQLNQTIALNLNNLPGGLYEITAEVRDEITVTRIWKGVQFARIMDTGTTVIGMTLLDAAIQTGSTELSINEDIDPLDISIIANSPSLEYSNSIGIGGSVTGIFTVDSPADMYKWYVNGEIATDEDVSNGSQTFTFTFNQTGQYTITCIAIVSNGNLGSAQCEILVVPSEDEN